MDNTTHIVAPLENNHSHTIILLHGRDSIASEFADEFFESQVSDGRTLPEMFPTVKWIFPASKIRNSARFNSEMSQWFDIWSVEEPSEQKEIQIGGLRDSIGEILSIIRNETLLIPPTRIILGGISQGCATAIHTLLYGRVRLGGFIGFCGWLPFQEDIATITARSKSAALQHIQSIIPGLANGSEVMPELSESSKGSVLETPIFLSHSQDDNVVPINNGRDLLRSVEELGFEVVWKHYEDGGHWIQEPRGVDDMVAFLHEKVRVGLPS